MPHRASFRPIFLTKICHCLRDRVHSPEHRVRWQTRPGTGSDCDLEFPWRTAAWPHSLSIRKPWRGREWSARLGIHAALHYGEGSPPVWISATIRRPGGQWAGHPGGRSSDAILIDAVTARDYAQFFDI